MILAGALVVGTAAAGAGVAGAGDPESPPEVSPTTAVTVEGAVYLPRTGSDIDADILLGVGLTAAGVALAGAARHRRRRLEAAAVAS
jgi:LPXTG-motif cell wall-anchored protein